MADPYTEYLNARNKGTTSTDPYTDYLNAKNQGTPQIGDPYQDYLNLLTQQSQLITPSPEEMDELKPTHPVGFGGALWEGFKSGMTLGYVADEPIEDMTYGEMSGMLIGEMAGGLIPLGLASTATGGFGAPVVAGARMKRAYNIIDKMRKVGKKLDKAKKLDNKAKITKHELTRNKLRKELVGFKEEYMREMAAKGLGTRGLKQLAKTPVMPQAAGKLGRQKWYQKSIKKVAEHYGPAGANALNRFASTGTAFALTGLARKRGEGPFGELEMADRLSGIPKDIWMGGLFTVAGLPSMLGVKGAGLIEPAALMGVGAYSDYLTGEPSDMSTEERLMHGMTLIGFHYIQQGLSNIGVKEKVYNALREMNFSESQALAISHNNKAFDAQIKAMRNGETFRYRNKRDKDDWTVVNMEGKREDGTAFIDLQNVQTLEKKTYTGKTLTEARENLHKEYDRFDYKDPKLKDDVYRRDDMDFQNRMRDDIIGEEIIKEPADTARKNQLKSQIKKVSEVQNWERYPEVRKIKSSEIEAGKKRTLNFSKDKDNFESMNKRLIDNVDLNEFQSVQKWPKGFQWMKPEERAELLWHIEVGRNRDKPWYSGKEIYEPVFKEDGTVNTARPQGIVDKKDLLYHLNGMYNKTGDYTKADFPINDLIYAKGETVVIPKLLRFERSGDKSWSDKEVQHAEIVKSWKDKKNPDKYVAHPDDNTLRVKTFMLDKNSADYGKEIELNIRARGSTKIKWPTDGERITESIENVAFRDAKYQEGPYPAERLYVPSSRRRLEESDIFGRWMNNNEPSEGWTITKDKNVLKSLGVDPKYAGMKMPMSLYQVKVKGKGKAGKLLQGTHWIERVMFQEMAKEHLGKRAKEGSKHLPGKLLPHKNLIEARRKENNPDLGINFQELYSRSNQDIMTVKLPPKEIEYLSRGEAYKERFGEYPRPKQYETIQSVETRLVELRKLKNLLEEDDMWIAENLVGLGYKVPKDRMELQKMKMQFFRDTLEKKLTSEDKAMWDFIKTLPEDANNPASRKIMRTRDKSISWNEHKWNWFTSNPGFTGEERVVGLRKMSKESLANAREEYSKFAKPAEWGGVTTGERIFETRKPKVHYWEWLAKLTDNYEHLKDKETKIREGKFVEPNVEALGREYPVTSVGAVLASATPKYKEKFKDTKSLSEGGTEGQDVFYTVDFKARKRGSKEEAKVVPHGEIGLRKGEWVFEDELEALRRAEREWSSAESSSAEFLNRHLSHLKNSASKYDINPDWQRFNNKKQQIKKSFKEQGLSNWEQIAFVSTLYPQSKTKSIGATLDKLTQSELNRVERFINKKESQPVYDSNIVSLMPDDMSSKASLIGNRMWNAVREYTLATAAYFEPLGHTGKRIARKLEQFSMWRANTMGTVVNFEKGMNAKLKEYGLNLTEVNEHIQIMRDPKYESLRDSRKYKKFLEKIEGVEVKPATKITPAKSLKEWIIESYDNFFDSMAGVLISSNSWVKTTTKDGKVESRRFINLYDKNGNAIELIDMYKRPDIHFDQVASFLTFIKDEGKGRVKTVIKFSERKHGDRRKKEKLVKEDKRKYQEEYWKESVEVDAKKSKHFYEATYSPRILSDRFLEISDIANRDSKKAIRDLMESEMIKDIPVSSARKEEIARQMFNEIINMQDASGVYGQQWSRIAELPSHYYLKQREGRLKFDKDNMEIIQVDNVVKANGELYKKGDKIVDKAGREHIVEEVVPVYERDYNKVMKRYSDGISHSTAAAHTYGSPHHGKILWKHLADKLSKEMDDTYYGTFAEKVIKNQLFGETRTRFDMIARPAARIGALTGLSSPMSPLKNILLGNVQNATVFTAKEMLQTMRHLSSGKTWKSAKEMSQFEGHTHIGSYDLFLAKEPFKGAHWLRKIAENAAVGGMRVTESFNRIFSATLSEFSLRNTVDNLAGIKNPANKRVPTYDSRRMMLDVFKFTPEEISSLIARRKRALELNEPMEYKATEMQRARYRGQLVTQGSGDIPYVPYWMGKQWAKPLTLFYRVAFRMTDTTANNVIKPIITDGNMIPAMKYVAGTVASGYAIYNMYDWILDEERVNKFKSMPNNMLQYFIKAEGLGIFSNLFGEYGGGIDSYEAVIYRNAKSFADMLVGFTKEAVRGEPEFAIKEVKDGVSEIVAGYNFYKGIWDRATGETRKLVKDSRRRQTQFLDAFYPKEKLDIDYDDGTTSKTAYYRAIRDNFWIDDSKRRAQSYYAALHYLTHTIMAEQGYTKRAAKKEARARLKRVMTRMRPIPTSWRKKPGRTKKSKYHEYYTRLPKGAQEQEDALDSLYIQKKQELYNAIRQYKNLYDTEDY